MTRALALPLALPLALLALHGSSQPLPPSLRAELSGRFWRPGCPVALSQLRVLIVSRWGFDGRPHSGQLVVNQDAAAPLLQVFRRLYQLRFPIHDMSLADAYGATRLSQRAADDTSGFDCRQASASPCTGKATTGHWSEHAYGKAIDLNPVENPYVGCGETRDRASRPYLDRSHLRKGMVTPAVVEAFRSIAWGWGGAWTGDTKDYMHFSATGH